jgi:hypothetical protein
MSEFQEPVNKIETFRWKCPIAECEFLIVAYSSEGRNQRMTMHLEGHQRRMVKNVNELELNDFDRKFLAEARIKI